MVPTSSPNIQSIIHVLRAGMLTIHLRTKFHTPGFNGSLVIATQRNLMTVLYDYRIFVT
jgi:hypothetical protein